MILVLLILIPLLSGILSFTVKGDGAKTLALVSAALSMALSAYVSGANFSAPITFTQPWIPILGTQFSLAADGMSSMLCLLTGIVSLVVMIVTLNKDVEKPGAFYGFLLLSQAGLMGVFLAYDALVFYVFWELALIPVYFLCSRWGGEKRIAVTFKFFIYTFVGSLMMLAGLIYLSMQTPGMSSYSWNDIVRAGSALPPATQQWLFWLIFIAFAIKMPIFPFHTWQPDTYEQSPTPVTIILSALMVKMGLYAVLRWLLPVLPAGVAYWSDTVIILSVIGIVYASCIAIVQTDLKRLIAYSSIAHMGLMSAVAFSHSQVGMHGILVQMFNHGINITGMWLMVSMVENRWGTRDMTKLGGMASVAPRMAIALVIISLANIALPLTNGFVGEFMLFNGLFGGHMIVMVIAGLGIILGAVYTLNMIQKTAYGNVTTMVIAKDLSINEYIGLAIIISLIIFLGVYPKPLLDLTSGIAGMIVR
ncbi:MAG: proton-translocating NADH-quinone oxidoreductase, chain [Flavipsychrobacter sp.]|nr:proton-translocating NADH-quinone oxidoreductase, chain [Flavipsychrobacter sp.]